MAVEPEWKFSQSFGDGRAQQQSDSQDADLVSAIQFDKNGDLLAVGDKGLIIFVFSLINLFCFDHLIFTNKMLTKKKIQSRMIIIA
jgi:hypothetical protein